MITSWAAIGVIVGLLLGLTGAGGAVIAVPLFVYFADVSIRDATTLSLLAVLTGSLFNWIFQFRATAYRLSFLLFLFSVVGSLAFKPLKAVASEWLITTLFIAVTFSSLFALWKKPTEEPSTVHNKKTHRLIKASAGGFALGGLITMTGLGGGVMLVPLLKRTFNSSMSQAAATSLLTVLLSSVFSLWLQFRTISTDIQIGPAFALISGSLVAAILAKYISVSMGPVALDRLRLGLITLVILLSAGGMIAKTSEIPAEKSSMFLTGEREP